MALTATTLLWRDSLVLTSHFSAYRNIWRDIRHFRFAIAQSSYWPTNHEGNVRLSWGLGSGQNGRTPPFCTKGCPKMTISTHHWFRNPPSWQSFYGYYLYKQVFLRMPSAALRLVVWNRQRQGWDIWTGLQIPNPQTQLSYGKEIRIYSGVKLTIHCVDIGRET
jgi:hypothetical protein